MANANFTGVIIAGAPHEWRRQFHRGWVDRQNGADWPRDDWKMSKTEQIAYEQGRLVAAETRVAGFAFPIWRGDRAGARAMDELWAALCRKLGHRPIPDTVEPPVDTVL